ncbi:MAG: hypothetical protein HC923_12355 [Myxococcales bacterium]|nr:hypothetical protein [Myxococcales bacterium]
MTASRGRRANDAPSDPRLIIVGHGGTNAVILSLLLGLPLAPWVWEQFVSLHASFTRVKAAPLLGGYVFGLREHSDASHLDPADRTR